MTNVATVTTDKKWLSNPSSMVLTVTHKSLPVTKMAIWVSSSIPSSAANRSSPAVRSANVGMWTVNGHPAVEISPAILVIHGHWDRRIRNFVQQTMSCRASMKDDQQWFLLNNERFNALDHLVAERNPLLKMLLLSGWKGKQPWPIAVS